MASTLESLVNEIDAGHVPATFGQLDCPDAAAGAEVERAAVGLLVSAFLRLQQLRERRHEWPLVQGLLPGVEAEAVGELVVHALWSARRNAAGCSSGGSSPASSMTCSGQPYRALAASATRSRFTGSCRPQISVVGIVIRWSCEGGIAG